MTHAQAQPAPLRCAALVLCGGESRRMGFPKAWLPFGPETLLERVVRAMGVGDRLQPVVVVAAAGQDLPLLPDDVIIVRDRRASRGPLEGLAAGLGWLAANQPLGEAAFVTSCDASRVTSELGLAVASFLGDAEIATPVLDGFCQPLLAVYRVSVLSHIEALLAADRLRPMDLFDLVPTRKITLPELQLAMPMWPSPRNLNTPADYLAELAACGLTADPAVVAQLGASAQRDKPSE